MGQRDFANDYDRTDWCNDTWSDISSAPEPPEGRACPDCDGTGCVEVGTSYDADEFRPTEYAHCKTCRGTRTVRCCGCGEFDWNADGECRTCAVAEAGGLLADALSLCARARVRAEVRSLIETALEALNREAAE